MIMGNTTKVMSITAKTRLLPHKTTNSYKIKITLAYIFYRQLSPCYHTNQQS